MRKTSKLFFITWFFMLILTASCLWAVPFKAGDVDMDIGGSIRLDTGWKYSNLGSVPATPAGQKNSQTLFFMEVPGDSRLHVQAVYKGLTGYCELGIGPYGSTNIAGTTNNGITMRHLYASYEFDSKNTFLVGHTTEVFTNMDPDQLLRNSTKLEGYGHFDTVRSPQLRYSRKFTNTVLNLCLENVKSVSMNTPATSSYQNNIFIPAVHASLIYQKGAAMIMPNAFFQTYKLEKNDDVATTKNLTVTSWGLALDAAFNTEPLLFSFELWYASNASLYPIDQRPSKKTSIFGAPVIDADGNLKNTGSFGGYIQFAVPVEKVVFYTGAGYQQAQVRNSDTSSISYNSNISTWGAFINLKINPLKNFYVRPEIAYFNNGRDAQKTLSGTGVTYNPGDNKLGHDIYTGVHFQYDF